MKRLKVDGWTLVTLVCFAFFAFFFLYPASRVFVNSIYDFETQSFTLEKFRYLLSTPYYTNTIINSAKVTASVTILSVLAGTTLAYISRTVKIRYKSFMDIAIIISVLSPPFIGAYAWIVLLGRAGVITKLLNSLFDVQLGGIYGFYGIMLVFSLKMIPLVYLYVSGALKNMDNSLNEAAESLGSVGLTKIRQIVLPLILPTMLATGLLVFMRVLADFGTPMLIGEGYRTLPVLIYNSFLGEVGRDEAFAAALSVTIVIFTTVVFLLQQYIANRKTIEMSAMRPMEPRKVTGWRNIASHAYAYTCVFLAILPLFVVFINSFRNTRGTIFVEGFSLNSYQRAFSAMGNAIQNTFVFSSIAIVLIVIIGVVIAYTAVRRKSMLTNVLDTITMFPYIIPGSVLGISLLLAFNNRPFLLSGTSLIIIVAYVIRRLPYTIRSSSAILKQINLSVEEASLSLGANQFKTFFGVTLPIMFPGVLAGALMSWITIISELSASILLYVGGTRTMTIAIYTEVIRGNFGVASALSTILITFTIIILLLFFKLTGKREINL
ncbi:MAG: iron ABC transporter permease [Firmicutes bacterium]|nr:iron ABC transporter permease [Bacillota bacterium]